MQESSSNDQSIHINNSFTELFYLLSPIKKSELNHSASHLNMAMMHTDNAITAILHGLQALGNLMATSVYDKEDIVHIGHFLTLTANLMEALNTLKADCEFQLKEKNQIEKDNFNISSENNSC